MLRGKTMTKKDFIGKHLIGRCINKVQESVSADVREQAINDIMAMNIIPYESADENGFSKLNSENMYWYYRTDNATPASKTSSNYRILDEKRLDAKHAKALKDIFGESGKNRLKKFSNKSIIDDLINRMSSFKDYDGEWWSCARDVYDLWDGKNPGDQFKKATERIIGNYFLFDSNCYCDKQTKQLLIKYGVYSDFFEHKCFNKFFANSNIEKVSQFLGFLGVPNKLVTKIDDRIERVEENFYKFIAHWTDRIDFPIKKDSDEYEKCELIERVTKNIFFRKYEWQFDRMLNNIECRKGIVIRNIYDEYIPVSETLFYNIPCRDYDDNSCDMLIINEKMYEQKYLEKLSTDIKSDLDPENFTFNALGNRKPFKNIIKLYSWIWQFNQSLVFTSNIIKNLSGSGEIRITDDTNSKFIIDLLIKINGEPAESVDLTVIMSDELSWNRAEDINFLFIKYFDQDTVSIICSEMTIQKYDAYGLKHHILDDVKQKLDDEWFWDKIYISDKSYEDDGYLILNKSLDNPENILVLKRNPDEKSYIRSIKRFIQQYYNASVNNLDEGIIDWKKEYNILANGIKDFISKKEKIKDLRQISFKTINMDDVPTYAREKAIWKDVQDTRERIRSARSMPDLTKVLGTRRFLESTYHGYCQLCKGKTCTSDVHSHFYMYRIVKPSKLSDPNFADMATNLFSVCPTCHGSLNYGQFMGFDMSNIITQSKKYVKYFLDKYEDFKNIQLFDNNLSLISELQGESISCDKDGMIVNPIVIKVTVNGEEKDMFFSWEHFIRLAMILNEDLIYNDD